MATTAEYNDLISAVSQSKIAAYESAIVNRLRGVNQPSEKQSYRDWKSSRATFYAHCREIAAQFPSIAEADSILISYHDDFTDSRARTKVFGKR